MIQTAFAISSLLSSAQAAMNDLYKTVFMAHMPCMNKKEGIL